jgi:exo-beta-1,3-glucanase (GH17 family)
MKRKIDLHLNIYDKLKTYSPEPPPYTCPYIDNVITDLESLRNQNDELREYSNYWKNQVKALCKEVHELNEIIKEYESEE